MRVEWKFGLPYPIEFIRRNVFLPSKFAAGFVGMVKERMLAGTKFNSRTTGVLH